MISLQRKLSIIGRALSEALPNKVSHYFRDNKTFPYCVWAEDGENASFSADNRKEEQSIHGTVDYFTQTEFDASVDVIQSTLQDIANNWSLVSVQYEDPQRVIHYEWEWTVLVDGGDVNG